LIGSGALGDPDGGALSLSRRSRRFFSLSSVHERRKAQKSAAASAPVSTSASQSITSVGSGEVFLRAEEKTPWTIAPTASDTSASPRSRSRRSLSISIQVTK
jgi:hypothetical protein